MGEWEGYLRVLVLKVTWPNIIIVQLSLSGVKLVNDCCQLTCNQFWQHRSGIQGGEATLKEEQQHQWRSINIKEDQKLKNKRQHQMKKAQQH